MYCNKCGNKLKEGMNFCNKCGNDNQEDEQLVNLINRLENEKTGENGKNEDKEEKNTGNSKIKFNISDVVNSKDVQASSNRVAYIAKGWALQVRNRGENLAIIAVVLYVIMGIIIQSNASYQDSTPYWLLYIGYAVIAFIVIRMVFNTIAFIIRMGAEIIQLLDDIKMQKGK